MLSRWYWLKRCEKQTRFWNITWDSETVERIHTDGGRSFTAQSLKAWAAPRGISVTTTEEADGPKANGRAEKGVRMIKEGMRLLLLQSKLDTAYWPAAARHSAERSLRHKLGRSFNSFSSNFWVEG